MARTLTTPGTDRNNRLIFYGAIGLALLAAILVFLALSNFGTSSSGGSASGLGGTTDVVVASQDISAGTKVSTDMLEIATLPTRSVVAGALTDKSLASGLVLRSDVAKGEQISATKLGQLDKNKTFSDVVPDGQRAVAVDVEEKTSVGGLIVAGDHVDVIVIGKVKSTDANQNQTPASFTLLQNVEVLSVAQDSQQPVARLDKDGNPIQTDTANGQIATRPSDTSATPKAKTVTLAVSPGDAERLALAADSYTIYLSLRGNGDQSTIPNPNDLQQLPQALQ